MSELLGITMYRKNGTCPWNRCSLTDFFRKMESDGHLRLSETYQQRQFKPVTAQMLDTVGMAAHIDKTFHGALEDLNGQSMLPISRLPDGEVQALEQLLAEWASKRYALGGRYIPDDPPDRVGPDKKVVMQVQLDNFRMQPKYQLNQWVSAHLADGFGVNTVTINSIRTTVDDGVLYRVFHHAWTVKPPRHLWYEGVTEAEYNALWIPEKYILQ